MLPSYSPLAFIGMSSCSNPSHIKNLAIELINDKDVDIGESADPNSKIMGSLKDLNEKMNTDNNSGTILMLMKTMRNKRKLDVYKNRAEQESPCKKNSKKQG